jgi:hypothetical protein
MSDVEATLPRPGAANVARHEFASPGWMAQLRSAIDAAIGAAEDPSTISFCSLGWHVRIANGAIDFREEPARDVDACIEGDCEAIAPIARLLVGGDPAREAEINRLAADAMAAGKFSITGNLASMPAALAGLHDAVAGFTA